MVISAVAPVSDLIEVELQPEGLHFDKPAELKLSYDRCLQPTNWLKLFIVYLSDARDQILEVKATLDKKGLRRFTPIWTTSHGTQWPGRTRTFSLRFVSPRSIDRGLSFAGHACHLSFVGGPSDHARELPCPEEPR